MYLLKLFLIQMLATLLVNVQANQFLTDSNDRFEILELILNDPEYLALSSIERLKVLNGVYKILDIKKEKPIVKSSKANQLNLKIKHRFDFFLK